MRIHWFAFTVHASDEFGRCLWDDIFMPSLGHLVDSTRKGRGFDRIDVALQEAKYYTSPLNLGDKPFYFHIELPGSACDCLLPSVYRDVVVYLRSSGHRFSIKRIDFAFDDCPFSPVQFCDAIVKEQAVTLAKRDTLSIVQSPYSIRDDGVMGCDTCYIGSKASQRFIRVYNQRGGTRLEFVCKDERAHVVALDVFQYDYSSWDDCALSHVLQYIRFHGFGLWDEFVNVRIPASIKISSARVVSLNSMKAWFNRQVAVALSVYFDVVADADEEFRHMLSFARIRNRDRYSSVLQLSA